MISSDDFYCKHDLHPWDLRKFINTTDHFEPDAWGDASKVVFSFEDKEGNIKSLALKDMYISDENLVFELKDKS